MGGTGGASSSDGATTSNGVSASSSSSSDSPSPSSSSDSEDSEIDVHRPVSPCNVTFVGANANTGGKSSLRSRRPRDKKVWSHSFPTLGKHNACDFFEMENSHLVSLPVTISRE